ncbi:formylglycine-generating enzyme family protein [Dactylosporangium sp. CA-139114]|uniref:formylglycine-generating enzyme family protein n=1 Tax=Dactylosporangium sp. CA-139114 TaxID=3239931 RepID=UPI003D98BB46
MNYPRRNLADQLIAAVRADRSLAAAARVPYLLHLLVASVEQKGFVPTSIGRFCKYAIDEFLLDRPRRRFANGGPACFRRPNYNSEIHSILEEIAFDIVSSAAGDRSATSISVRMINEPISRALAADEGEDFLDVFPVTLDYIHYLRDGYGLLTAVPSSHFTFRQTMFRDYFAGCALVRRDSALLIELCRDEVWHAPLRLWASAQGDMAGRRSARQIANELYEADSPALAVLAGEVLASVAAETPTGRSSALKSDILAVAAQLVGDRGTPLRMRDRAATMSAALAAGEQDQPQMPALVWLPAGSFPIGRHLPGGSAEEKYQAEYIAWRPARRETFDRFAIATYPVTNREYSHFISAAGYSNADLWPVGPARRWAAQDADFIDGEHGPRESFIRSQRLHFRKELSEGIVDHDFIEEFVDQLLMRNVPLYWWDPRYNGPAQPVVGVNWWEALAYCRWLTNVMRRADRIGPADRFDLPTEFEWERACMDVPDGRAHPWAGAWSDDMAHVRREHGDWLQYAVPVGLFPWSTWSGGPLDLVGNVWEWTRSKAVSYGAEEPGRHDLQGDADRVVRGGSWFSREPLSREVQFRSFDPPQNAYVDLGFRVALYTGPSES